MASDWPQSTLGHEAEILTGFPFKSADYADGGVRLLRGDNVAQGQVRWDGVKLWPEERIGEVLEYQLERHDVVLAMDRPWIEAGLKYGVISDHDLPAILVQRVARLRGGPRLDQRFLRYIIGSRQFTNHVLAVQTGSAVPHISKGQIEEFKFLLPPLDAQRFIAEILGSIDDKSDLNKRTNKSLDTLARAIFKAWFIDFEPVKAKVAGKTSFRGMPNGAFDGLPNQLSESELGLIPVGWEVAAIDDIGDYVNGRPFTTHANGQGRMIIRIAELNSGPGGATRYSDIDTEPQYIAFPNDLLFAWSGSLGVHRWHRDEAIINQHIFKVIPNDRPKWYVYYRLVEAMPFFEAIASTKATTMGHIQRGHLSQAVFAEPPKWLIDAADNLIRPLFDLVHNNQRESINLDAIRDALLPRLISGEIRNSRNPSGNLDFSTDSWRGVIRVVVCALHPLRPSWLGASEESVPND